MASSCSFPEEKSSSTSQDTPCLSSKNPWGVHARSPVSSTSFEDVMSEQLAVALHLSDSINMAKSSEQADVVGSSKEEYPNELLVDEPDTSNDAVLAQMLQTEMDKEYNEMLSSQERHFNKNSKVKVLYSNYRTDDMFLSDDDDDEYSDDEIVSNHQPDQCSNMLSFNKEKEYVMFGKEYITKHDKEICGRRNTVRLEKSFPTNFRTGDATGMDLKLNNKIFNSLRKHAFAEEKRGQRLHENKQHSTAEHAVDERTRLILHRFIDRGIISAVNGIISIGKEAVVVHADGGDVVTNDLEPINNENNRDITCSTIPKECAIKVFKTTLNEFKTRDKYIKDDYRFKDRFKKLNPRKIINMWAEKEMHNLVRMFKAGIPCPEVVLLKKHVLVMSFIGEGHQAAPKLKNAILSSAQKTLAYEQVVDMMKTLYKKCNLIHADLSEFNLLWHDETVWMIDVSQSVETSHPHGLEFLLRDCTNVSKFFKHFGVPKVSDPLELFNEVSELNIPIEDATAFLETIKKLEAAAEEHSHQGRNKSKQIFDHRLVLSG